MLYTTKTPLETQQLAKKLLPKLLKARIILLKGNLGSGKTTFVKGIATALGIIANIKSPTYTYVNTYLLPTKPFPLHTLHHFDLYRLPKSIENPAHTAAEIGLEQALQNPTNLVIIEWPERLPYFENTANISFNNHKDHHDIHTNFC